MLSNGKYDRDKIHFISRLLKIIRLNKISQYLGIICFIIGISFILNLFLIIYSYRYSLLSELKQLETMNSKTKYSNNDIISTIERSKKALEKLKLLLSSVSSPIDQPWIWTPTKKYPSVPYQPTLLINQTIPKILYNITSLPQSVLNEVNRVCQQLKQANNISGKIWCKLFNQSYTDTLLRTTSILDDNSTYIITGDIDLMWLRDSR